MIRINLLSEQSKPKVARLGKQTQEALSADPATVWMLGLVVAALLAGGVWYWQLRSESKQLVAEIAEVQVEVDRLRPIIEEVEEFERQRADLQNKVTVINDLKARQQVPVRILDVISRSLPERLWLTRVQQRRTSVTVTGKAFNTNAIAAFLDSLDQVPGMTEPVLRETKRDRRSGANAVYDFSVVFRLETQKPEEDNAATQAASR